MRISNAIRAIEDGSIKATKAITPKASWLARKTTMTAIAIVVLPVAIIANATIAAAETVVTVGSTGIKAIREV